MKEIILAVIAFVLLGIYAQLQSINNHLLGMNGHVGSITSQFQQFNTREELKYRRQLNQ